MEQFSISLTLGKASDPHGANPRHNNREFIAKNVDVKRTHQNITYVRKDVEDVYEKLFGAAVAEYNAKQKQPCRRIEDYYVHIRDGKREEAFYEIIVQFGDSKTAPCGSERGEAATKMLDEYVRSFVKRNPNLVIFNAVLHLDEASPHLHINFIPVYTQPRTRGLRVGVSMKQALIEQGFSPKGKRSNQVVAWERSERKIMEEILHRHGFAREDKHTKHPHMTVEQFKEYCEFLNEKQRIADIPDHIDWEQIKALYDHVHELEVENQTLKHEKYSPYMSFFYTDPDKQSYVQMKMESQKIPFRETENGFEAQECFVQRIRYIEKQYKPHQSYREKLRDDVDCTLMQSQTFDGFLKRMELLGYEIKQGKYLAMRPAGGENFIRLKSLGEHYYDTALKNRLRSKLEFEKDCAEKGKIAESENKYSEKCWVLKTIQFYTVSFRKGGLRMKRRHSQKPFTWKNDAELDILLRLNKMINAGATLDSLRNDFTKQGQILEDCEKAVQNSQRGLDSFLDLKEKISIVFQGKKSTKYTDSQACAALREYPMITMDNYRKIDELVQSETEKLQKAKENLQAEKQKLKDTSDLVTAMERVMNGTFVQNLIGEERQRRESKFVLNGLKRV